MQLVPKNFDVKVNMGRWKPPMEEKDPVKRLPKAELLQKAPLWLDPRWKQIREMLASAALRVDVQASVDQAKVETSRGRGTIEIFKRDQGMPRTLSSLPFSLMVLDCRDLTLDDINIFKALPGLPRSPLCPPL